MRTSARSNKSGCCFHENPKTSNIQHPTSNAQWSDCGRRPHWMFSVGCWMLDVPVPMNIFQTILILAFAFLAVFGEAVCDAPRHLLGTQINLLPALMIFAALNAGLPTLALLAAAGAAGPPLTILMRGSASQEPMPGWGSLWQLIVMPAGGAVATPFIFALMDWCNRALGYQVRTENSFRPDREIQRSRKKI